MDVSKFGESMRSAGGRGTGLVLLILCILLSLIVLKLMWPGFAARREAKRRFRRFADANGLASAERRLLLQMGRMKYPEDPLLIYVSPSGFDAAAAAMGVQNPELRRKLFGA